MPRKHPEPWLNWRKSKEVTGWLKRLEKPTDKPTWLEQTAYDERIRPRLVDFSTATIALEIGVSTLTPRIFGIAEENRIRDIG